MADCSEVHPDLVHTACLGRNFDQRCGGARRQHAIICKSGLGVCFARIGRAHQIESTGLNFDERQVNLAFLHHQFAANQREIALL
jgi:hypothetical protein